MRRSAFGSGFVGTALLVLGLVPAAHGQETLAAAEGRGPQFLLAAAQPSQPPTPVDAASVPVLRRRVSVDLEDVDRTEALAAISRASGLRLVYANGVVPREGRVRLKAEEITVAAALTEVLLDAGVDVLLAPGGNAVLVKRTAARAPAVGTIVGRVTDASTDEPLPMAEVYLEGTRRRTTTDDDGRYQLAEVEEGDYTLTVRRVGYAKRSQRVAVVPEEEVTVDVTLEPVPTQLDEIVTTVTGDQRRLELGHVVGRIDADSLVREAPVASLGELLTGRVPGLQVFQEAGSVGGRVNVRIRGPNSLTSDNQPIVIIDGVRYTTQEKTRLLATTISETEPTSPLNDLNPNDIESIEVVKGPSAATLYGTDAANGVLVITTKRGRAGPARWNAYAKGSMTEVPVQQFPEAYRGWGTVFGVPDNPTDSCTLGSLADGSCTQQDSVTVLPGALNDRLLTIFATKPRWETGMNVAGGGEDLHYYFSADFEDATGPVQMPRALADRLLRQRGLSELPEEWREPNTFTKLNLRSNVNAAFGDRLDLRVNLGYVGSDTRTLTTGSRVYEIGYYTSDYSGGGGLHNPAQAFAQTTNERVDRFLGSAGGNWRPARWLEARATVGLDHTTSHRDGYVAPGDQHPLGLNGLGRADDARRTHMVTTADLGVTATARRGRLSARTGVGVQYVRTYNSGFGASGSGLSPGQKSPFGATTVEISQTHEETVLLGGYLEEVLGLNDRLFLTGAARLDGASTFGRDYEAAVYPKVGASWLLSEEPFLPRLPGLEELRLRYAFGASGRQPAPDAARPGLFSFPVVVDGQVQNSVQLFSPGNPDLRPERVREHEFGFDLSVLSNRLSAEVTWFRRRTVDQHIIELGPTGRGPITTNLGLTRQRGFEAALRARVLDARRLTWDITLQHSDYSTLLADLGEATLVRSPYGGYVEGYPLGARFRPPMSFADANGDGIIAPSEIQVGDTAIYMGQSLPPRSQTLTSVVGLFGGRLRLSALLERKSGFTQINPYWCRVSTCREAVDPSTPLAQQAKAVGANLPGQAPAPPIEKGDYTRLREVTAALDLPSALIGPLPFSRGTLVVSARNLALWTDFSGVDPEVGGFPATDFFQPVGVQPVSGGAAAGIPLGRVYSVRLDLGF